MFGGRTSARLNGSAQTGGAVGNRTTGTGAAANTMSGERGGTVGNGDRALNAQRAARAATNRGQGGPDPLRGADPNGIRAYADLGVPVPQPGGIAGGIANPEPGYIGPDGLDYSIEFPPDVSGVAASADYGVPPEATSRAIGGIGGDVANSEAASGLIEVFPPDVSSEGVQGTAGIGGSTAGGGGAGMFNGRTRAGFRGLDADTPTNGQRPGRVRTAGEREALQGTIPSSRPNGRNQRGTSSLIERFGDE